MTGMYWQCDCGDFHFRRDGLCPLGCRHIQIVKHILGYPESHFDHSIRVQQTEGEPWTESLEL